MSAAGTRECDYCGGRGWYSETEHGPGCTTERCEQPCPVERMVECPTCVGRGVVAEYEPSAQEWNDAQGGGADG